jgi:hypothetical protein
MVQQYADYTGISVKVVRDYAKVLQIRKQRAQAAAEQQALAQTAAAVQGAKVLSETNVGQGRNALESMVSA